MVVWRIIEPGVFAVAELRVELRPLECEGIDKGGVAPEVAAMPLGFRHQAAPDPDPAQIGLHPQQCDEQPARIAIADQPGPDRVDLVTNENAEIRVGWVPQKRRVIGTKRLLDGLAVLRGWIVLEDEAKRWRQFHFGSHGARIGWETTGQTVAVG